MAKVRSECDIHRDGKMALIVEAVCRRFFEHGGVILTSMRSRPDAAGRGEGVSSRRADDADDAAGGSEM